MKLSKSIKYLILRILPSTIRHFIIQFKIKLSEQPDYAITGGYRYTVIPDKFWVKFNKGEWEPDLNNFYKKYISKEKEILDIGSWIGPSVLLAGSLKPKKITAVEADPDTFSTLKTNCLNNNLLENIVELNNLCISNKSGERVTFGFLDQNFPYSTVKGIGGVGFETETISFIDFLSEKNINHFNIIKIDIEGSERFLIEGLNYLSEYPELKIFLALHPPFWPDKKKAAASLLEVFQKYEVYHSNEEPISLFELEKEMLSDDKTRYRSKTGKFFDLILKTSS